MKQHPDLSAYGIESHWLRERAAAHRLLVIYAHPDDESFGNAGTITRYSAAGAEVHARTANGDIRVGVLGTGTADLYTATGEIAIGVPAGTTAALDARASIGRIFDNQDDQDTPDTATDTATITDPRAATARTIHRTVTVRARTHGGNITVSPA